ncbi:serine/threonine protein kinase [Bifidobacterium vespertilionis]|uniref:non-specific serine/threonine protein kinase n=1 Tax=Bifidobacterium vespertilionis TaxID=2562524 RepID=A0A5J5DUQ8_9BIFI|nr:serine/threonine protein kinase [Bifidobacterium vespertilionis]KAA8821094.1 serine/threonine protein kinase [Bifidobacterium vespertilionis]
MSDVGVLDLEPGAIVGGYTLISRLGAGAMGSVWRVSDDGGQIYAMKILRDSLNDDELRSNVPARERLRREAMAMRRIHHPGVCQIVDMELDDAVAFIVTELIDGRNLKDDVAANGRYEGDDLERLATKLIDAVKAVHAAGIVHRDIKPTNVMVAARGPVLVDFGIAMGEGESHVTRTGLVMGTPGFIAPEIIDGAESTEATDWWSTAAVLAFAATGEPVFGTKPMMAVLERAASGNANLTGLPPRTMAAFRSALSPNPADRRTPDDLLQAIAEDAMEAGAWSADDEEADAVIPTAILATPPAPPAPASALPSFSLTSSGQTDQSGPRSASSADPTPRQGAETQVVRPFGASSSAAAETVVIGGGASAPAIIPSRTRPLRETDPARGTDLERSASPAHPARETDEDNPRTLWDLNPWRPNAQSAPGNRQTTSPQASPTAQTGPQPRQSERLAALVALTANAQATDGTQTPADGDASDGTDDPNESDVSNTSNTLYDGEPNASDEPDDSDSTVDPNGQRPASGPRSDLIVGLAVTAMFLVAIVAAFFGM